MSRFKTLVLIGLTAVVAMFATPVFAQRFEVYSGGVWSNTGTVTITGPTIATVNGILVPCTAGYVLTITGGVAKVTGASFSGSSACTGIDSGTLPWSLTVAFISGSTSVKITITGISLSFSQPSAVCSNGTATGTLTNANPNSGPSNNNFTFTASFPSPTACTNVRSTGNMSLSKPIRVTIP